MISNGHPYSFSDCCRHTDALLRQPHAPRVLRRQQLCKTIAGFPCDILTVTDFEAPQKAIARRKIVVFSARVHPGEPGASWMMRGTLDFLTSATAKALQLRNHFVFKVVPMLNIDGCVFGNNRCNLSGVDLNRQWGRPDMHLHPTIFHLKKTIRQLMSGAQAGLNGEVLLYVDFHGHSRKKNIFLYGVEPKNAPHTASPLVRLLPKTLSASELGRHMFSYEDCIFHVQKGRDATARAVVARELGVKASFTMEATFAGASLRHSSVCGCHFSTRHLEQAGQALCEALLSCQACGTVDNAMLDSWKLAQALSAAAGGGGGGGGPRTGGCAAASARRLLAPAAAAAAGAAAKGDGGGGGGRRRRAGKRRSSASSRSGRGRSNSSSGGGGGGKSAFSAGTGVGAAGGGGGGGGGAAGADAAAASRGAAASSLLPRGDLVGRRTPEQLFAERNAAAAARHPQHSMLFAPVLDAPKPAAEQKSGNKGGRRRRNSRKKHADARPNTTALGSVGRYLGSKDGDVSARRTSSSGRHKRGKKKWRKKKAKSGKQAMSEIDKVLASLANAANESKARQQRNRTVFTPPAAASGAALPPTPPRAAADVMRLPSTATATQRAAAAVPRQPRLAFPAVSDHGGGGGGGGGEGFGGLPTMTRGVSSLPG